MELSPFSVSRLYPKMLFVLRQPTKPIVSAAQPVEKPSIAAPSKLAELQQSDESTDKINASLSISKKHEDKHFTEVIWYAKPGATVTVILSANEFKDAACVAVLKKIVAALGLAQNQVAFGKVSGELQPSQLEEQPTPLGIVFGESILPGVGPILKAAQRRVLVVESLARLQSDQAAKKRAWEALKAFIPNSNA